MRTQFGVEIVIQLPRVEERRTSAGKGPYPVHCGS